MALPPGLAVSVLKAIFQEVHVQVSEDSHFCILCLPALTYMKRIRWQKKYCLLSPEPFQVFDYVYMLVFARRSQAIMSDLRPLTPEENETDRFRLLDQLL